MYFAECEAVTKNVNINEQHKCWIRRLFQWIWTSDKNMEKFQQMVDIVSEQH